MSRWWNKMLLLPHMYDSAYRELGGIEHKVKSNPAYRHLRDYIDDWIEQQSNTGRIIDAILDKDVSRPVREMVQRTKFRARVELYSNYDCQISSVGLNRTHHYDGYFKDMVDLLCLNPARLKQELDDYGFTTEGVWPDEPERIPAVRYRDFAVEIDSQIYTCLMVFMGLFRLPPCTITGSSRIKDSSYPKATFAECSATGTAAAPALKWS